MSLALYAAATGMEAQNIALATIANNLANVQTTGFKQSQVEFKDLLYQNIKTKGADTGAGGTIPVGVEIGNGSQVASTTKIFTNGDFKQTDNQFHLAINGDGFFQVQLPDGTTAYTRDGSLKLSADGNVVTSEGYPVLGGFQPLPAGSNLYVTANGEVTVVSSGGKQNFVLQLARFNNPAGLESMGGNLYKETTASGAAQISNAGLNGMGSLMQGFLEMSNVNVTDEMVKMIVAQRVHEAMSKAIQSGDDMMARINQIRRS